MDYFLCYPYYIRFLVRWLVPPVTTNTEFIEISRCFLKATQLIYVLEVVRDAECA